MLFAQFLLIIEAFEPFPHNPASTITDLDFLWNIGLGAPSDLAFRHYGAVIDCFTGPFDIQSLLLFLGEGEILPQLAQDTDVRDVALAREDVEQHESVEEFEFHDRYV